LKDNRISTDILNQIKYEFGKINNGNNFQDNKKFAISLKELGKFSKNKDIVELANNLISASDSFDIKAVRYIIDDLKNLFID